MFLLSNNCKRKTHIFNVNAFTSLPQLSNYLMRRCLCLNTGNSRASQHPIVSNILTRYFWINCLVYHRKNPTTLQQKSPWSSPYTWYPKQPSFKVVSIGWFQIFTWEMVGNHQTSTLYWLFWGPIFIYIYISLAQPTPPTKTAVTPPRLPSQGTKVAGLVAVVCNRRLSLLVPRKSKSRSLSQLENMRTKEVG